MYSCPMPRMPLDRDQGVADELYRDLLGQPYPRPHSNRLQGGCAMQMLAVVRLPVFMRQTAVGTEDGALWPSHARPHGQASNPKTRAADPSIFHILATGIGIRDTASLL